MRISDWSSDVCSSDLTWRNGVNGDVLGAQALCQRFHHPMDGCLRSCVSINFARPHLQCADRSDIDNCRRALMRRSGSEEWQELLRHEEGRLEIEIHDLIPTLDRKSTRLNSSH